MLCMAVGHKEAKASDGMLSMYLNCGQTELGHDAQMYGKDGPGYLSFVLECHHFGAGWGNFGWGVKAQHVVGFSPRPGRGTLVWLAW